MAQRKLRALGAYRQKRDFARTPEPAGGATAPGGWLYVIQKHAASRLHYDFRLQIGDTLKSWAVPKGPSLDPGEKRLAVEVEDHPLEYGSFEGVIPKGQYGGGTVMIWDSGTWEPLDDAEESYRKGKLKFRLKGKKLRGVWNLVRMQGKPSEKTTNWLLIKEQDDAARALGVGDVLAERAESARTGRSLAEIAASADRVWQSKGAKAKTPRRKRRTIDPAAIPGARRARLPARLLPQLATLVKKAPAGDDWLHEIKLDGERILAFVHDGPVRLITRNGKDQTGTFPTIAAAVADLGLADSILDGEVVALDANGISSLQTLQNALSLGERAELVYYVFDLPFHGGYDLRPAPLTARKDALARLLAGMAKGVIRLSDHVAGRGPEVFERACRLGVEGLVAKRAGSRYASGRSRSWLAVKCGKRQEGVRATPQGSAPVAGRRVSRVPLTNPDRVLYPELGLTKAQLVGYYETVGDWILRHVAGRPLSLLRCPTGRQGPCFFHKHRTAGFPGAVHGVEIQEKGKHAIHVMIDDLEGLVSLVQQGALEFHPWGCRADDVERPDLLVFDLDPAPGVAWRDVAHAAHSLRDLLGALGLTSFARTSGGKGVHVVVPLVRRATWEEVKAFCRAVALALVRREPARYVATASKSARTGKIFVDYLRNGRGATAIASYSTRARAGAPVATPIGWSELAAIGSGEAFSIASVPARLAGGADPWSGFFELRQSLTAAARKKVERQA